MTGPVRVTVLTRDLMDGSRFRALGEGVEVRRSLDVEPGAAVPPPVDLIVVDLAGGHDLASLVAIGPPVLAYGAHVDTDALERAVAAGCVDAVPRSVVVRRVAALMAGEAVGSPLVSDPPYPDDVNGFAPASFPDILAGVARVEGWMTDDQARRLHDRARALGAGARIVEIGSFRGRSLIVLARSAVPGVEIVSIDPHAGSDRGPQEIEADQARGDDDHSVYEANLTAAGVRDRVRHIRAMSDAALHVLPAGADGAIDLLYIDGAHRFGPARSDIVRWGERVSGGGVMLIHDSFSSIGVTLALLTTTFLSGDWRYVGRSQSMAEYRRELLTGRERVGNLLRQSLQLPWFARNVAIKVLLTLNLAPLTRILGHRTRDWPY